MSVKDIPRTFQESPYLKDESVCQKGLFYLKLFFSNLPMLLTKAIAHLPALAAPVQRPCVPHNRLICHPCPGTEASWFCPNNYMAYILSLFSAHYHLWPLWAVWRLKAHQQRHHQQPQEDLLPSPLHHCPGLPSLPHHHAVALSLTWCSHLLHFLSVTYKKGTTEDKMVGGHHQLNGHEFEQAPGDGDGQGSLAFCSPWGCKELDTTELLNNNNYVLRKQVLPCSSTRLVIPWYPELVRTALSEFHRSTCLRSTTPPVKKRTTRSLFEPAAF